MQSPAYVFLKPMNDLTYILCNVIWYPGSLSTWRITMLSLTLPGSGLRRALADTENPHSLSSHLRLRRMKHIIRLIQEVHFSKGSVTMLDVGGTTRFWAPVRDTLVACNAHITVLNMVSEKGVASDDTVFASVVGNGCSMPEFATGQFDLVVSNSVIEHVGTWKDIRQFAAEIQRVGRICFVQTPNFWFPVEPHYVFPVIHWLPTPVRAYLFTKIAFPRMRKARNLAEAMEMADRAPYLLTKRMMHVLFPKAELQVERVAFLAKSLMAVSR